MQFKGLICLFLIFVSLGLSGNEIDSLKRQALQVEDQRELGKIHSRLGWLHIVSSPATAEAYIDSAIENYRAIDDSAGIANSWYRYAVLSRFTGDYDRAASLMDQNLAFYTARSDTIKIINALYQKGVIYSLQGRYDKSLEAYFTILDVYETLEDSVSMGFTLNSIGVVFKNMRKYSDAEAVLQRAIAINRSMGDRENLANALSNLGSVYAESGDHEKAIDFFREAKFIDRDLGILWGEAMNEMNQGTAYLNLGLYEDALPHLRAAYEIQKTNGYTADLTETSAKMGKAWLGLNKIDSAEAIIRRGLEQDVPSFNTKMELFSALSLALESKEDFAGALTARKMQSAYQDSIFNETNAKMANVWAAEYGIKEKNMELAEKDELLEEQDFLIDEMQSRTTLAIGGGGLALILAFLIWLFYRQKQRIKNQEIENLTKQKEITALESYIKGEENERGRLARDLHDGLNGDLSVVKYKVSSMEDKNLNPSGAKQRLEAIELIDKACAQVRAISHNLAPQVLTEFSLQEALDQYLARLNSGSDIHFSFQYFGEPTGFETEKETVIFRMIQEMTNNILKHSKATDAMVQLNRHDDQLVVTVEDNGCGFETDAVGSGLGLKTIQSRIDYLNADCELTSNSEGTTYVIHVPVSKKIPA